MYSYDCFLGKIVTQTLFLREGHSENGGLRQVHATSYNVRIDMRIQAFMAEVDEAFEISVPTEERFFFLVPFNYKFPVR